MLNGSRWNCRCTNVARPSIPFRRSVYPQAIYTFSAPRKSFSMAHRSADRLYHRQLHSRINLNFYPSPLYHHCYCRLFPLWSSLKKLPVPHPFLPHSQLYKFSRLFFCRYSFHLFYPVATSLQYSFLPSVIRLCADVPFIAPSRYCLPAAPAFLYELRPLGHLLLPMSFPNCHFSQLLCFL